MIRVEPQPEPPDFDHRVRQPGLRALAENRDPLPAHWRPAIERWSESGNVTAFGDELDEMLTRTAVGMFATADPLGPGVPVAYVWAKENEVANLRTIGAAIVAGVPPEEIEKDLVIL